MKALLTSFIAAAALLGVAHAQAGNIAAGETKAKAQCAACHATGGDWDKPIDGNTPKLAGQHKDYLVQALLAYKQGDKSIMGRKNPIMSGQAQALTSKEIDDLAAFFGSMKGTLGIKR